MAEKFEANFDSLRAHTTPTWFRDAKFGIWSHWGPQSVPMYGDWYARNMYIEGSDQYRYHVRHYGHPSEFGYKDICALWHAEKFDPAELMALYVKAGAKYFVSQAMHHDHFFNYASDINPMNSVQVGPHQDIVGRWRQEAKKYGLPFGVTEHLGASFSWWWVNKMHDTYGPYAGVPYDGNDPKYRQFYHADEKHIQDEPGKMAMWYTDDPAFRAYWLRCMKELISRYTPDLLYTDGCLPFHEGWTNPGDPVREEDYLEGLEMVAYLYNRSAEEYGTNRAVYTQKDRNPNVYRVGTLDVEKSQLEGILADPWQTDTCIGNWFYDVRQVYKHPDQIIEMLIDIVSKNGTMLMNVLQKPDGTIDAEARYILEELATWFPVLGEGIYETRPWKVFGEGETRVKIQGFTEEKTAWAASDIRYTHKDNTVYAFLMGGARNHKTVLYSFDQGEEIRSVRLVGAGEVPFTHSLGVLTVALPDKMPTKYTNALAIELK